MIDDEIAGDPMDDRKWVRRSLKYLAKALVKRRLFRGFHPRGGYACGYEEIMGRLAGFGPRGHPGL